MNATINRLAKAFVVLFVLLVGTLTYWQVFAADELRQKMPYNAPRLLAAEQRIARGTIFDCNGKPLAWSERVAGEQTRAYADASLAHVVGYASAGFGTSNLENAYNDYLLGSKGRNPFDVLRTNFLYQPSRGSDVVTTLDLDLQRIADEALGEARGALIAIDPRTGAVLAAVSHPNFDPEAVDEQWQKLVADPAKPLVNRAFSGQYVPGSTFKVVTLTAALEAGVADITTKFNADKPLVVDGYTIRYTHPPDLTTFDLKHAFAFSVNAAFAELGARLGADRLLKAAGAFGFGEEPPLDGLPTAASALYRTESFLTGRPALAATSFGQGEILATPLQMLLTATAPANKGAIMAPYLVQQVRTAEGHSLYHATPRIWKNPMNANTASLVTEMMSFSVSDGLAAAAAIPGYQVAGKTGTAEIGEGSESHAWFIGFAPAEAPRIAVVAIKEKAGQGSLQAIPPARAVMAAWLEMSESR